jgi:hypothetical protein
MPQQPWNAVRLHGGERGIEAAAAERAHLIDHPRRHHGIEAHIDAAVELCPLDLEENLDRAVGIERGLHAVVVPLGERAAGGQHDLERAADAGAIARHQAARGLRIALAKLGIKRAYALGREPGAYPRANAGRDRRDRGEPAGQRLEVKAGAADHDGQAPCPLDRRQRRGGIDAPAAD